MRTHPAQPLPGEREDVISRLPPDAVAGILLAARTILRQRGLACPAVVDILAATGVAATRAYTSRSAILRVASTLGRPRGRPRGTGASADVTALSQRVLRYLMDHPGAVGGTSERHSYSLAFKRFILELRDHYADLDQSAFSRAVQVPAAVIEDWRDHAGRPAQAVTPRAARAGDPSDTGAALADDPSDTRGRGHIAMLVRAWQRWTGTFSSFCQHVITNLGIPWQRSVIARVLAARGQRVPFQRRSRRVHAHAPRGSFRTAFPGAQWVSDGTVTDVCLNGERHRFNVQLVVDTYSAAILGASVRDHEDGEAVLGALRDAIDTAESPPLSLLLDQRPCNHSPEVKKLGDTLALIYAAPHRPQSKAHVEGAFGLFSQVMPPLEIHADTSRELARAFLDLLVRCWACTLNHRPRRHRAGLSRAELYLRGDPTPERHDDVRAALRARSVRSARIRRMRGARRACRPSALRAFLQQELARLGIPDPDGYVRSALLGHSFDAVLAGMATYEGKRDARTLPEGVDGRYLIGIVRRIGEIDEGMCIADALWRARTEARAHVLEALAETEQRIVATAQSTADCVAALVDAALAAENSVEQQFWLAAVGRAICGAPEHVSALYRQAVRRIHAAHDLPYRLRQAYVRWLAVELIPIP